MDSFLLHVPFKETENTSFNLPLKNYIESNFDQDSAIYQQDLDSLDTLRMEISHPQEHDESALYHLKCICFMLDITVSCYFWNQSLKLTKIIFKSFLLGVMHLEKDLLGLEKKKLLLVLGINRCFIK